MDLTKSTDSDSILLNQIVNQGINIYGSREKIRSALIEYAKSYLNLGDADLTKTNYLAYLIDQLSILSANHIFYDSTIYNEFFFTEAKLDESVLNLARWIGYNVPKATPAEVELMFGINLNFNSDTVTFDIPPIFYTRAGTDIPFIIKNNNLDSDNSAKFNLNKSDSESFESIRGKVVNNNIVTVRDAQGNYRPIYISEDGRTAYFYLTFQQKEIVVQTFNVPNDLSSNQFYNIDVEFDGQVSDVEVFVISPNPNQKLVTSGSSLDGVINAQTFEPTEELYDSSGSICSWNKWNEAQSGIYSMSSKYNEYCWVGGYNKGTIMFGNGILGKQPKPGSVIAVRLHVTKGSAGNVIANTIVNGDTIYQNTTSYNTRGGTVGYTVINNSSASGGRDLLTLPEIKRNAIANLSAKNRLVSEEDYNSVNTILGGNYPINDSYSILKRSDIKCNEIMLFTTLKYTNNGTEEIVPTRNIYIDLDNPNWNSDGKYTIMRNNEYTVNNDKFLTMFNMTLDRKTKIVDYDYILQNLNGSSVYKYSKIKDNYYDQFSNISGNGSNFSINTNNTLLLNEVYPLTVTFNVNHNPQFNPDGWKDNFNATTLCAILNNGGFKVEDFQCKMVTKWGENKIYAPTASYGYSYTKNDNGAYSSFSWIIDNYLLVPDGNQRFEFEIEGYAPRRTLDDEFIGEDGSIIITRARNSKYVPVDGKESVRPQMVWNSLHTYYSDIVIRRNLSNFMQSTITLHEDGKCRIHNVPVILTSYYNYVIDEANTKNNNFELNVMQKLISGLSFNNKKMLTDFINIKFSDTYGVMTNLRYNKPEFTVESRYSNTPWWNTIQQNIPQGTITNPNYGSGSDTDPKAQDGQVGIYYIANGIIEEMGNTPLSEYLGYIVLRTVAGDAPNYTYGYQIIEPTRGMYVRIKDELDQDGFLNTVVWTGRSWKNVNEYEIPLEIKIKVEVNETKTSKSDESITLEIIDALTAYFADKMGIQRNIDRSEIVKVVRSIVGIEYAEVLNPEFDIRFEYDVNDLTQKQMLDFTPQYIGFRGKPGNEQDYSKSSINVEIVRI